MGYGSSNEVYSDIHLVQDVGLIDKACFDSLEAKILPVQKQLSKLIGSIDARIGRKVRKRTRD